MEAGFPAEQIDTSRAHPARMYDFYLGGKDNYLVDRQAAAQVIARAPEVRDIARVNRAFLGRVVRYLAAEKGISQFLDIGTGIPTAGNVHEVAQQAIPGARVVYADNDPIVSTHASALLTGTGTTGIVLADLRDPHGILGHPKTRELLDFSRPAALLLIAILHFIAEEDKPLEILAAFRDALPPGSYLAISHATSDFRTQAATEAMQVYDNATSAVTLRTRQQVTELFTGWDLEEPGVVQAPLWRPDAPPPRNLNKIWLYGGAGRLR
jgi:hypothetical protein